MTPEQIIQRVRELDQKATKEWGFDSWASRVHLFQRSGLTDVGFVTSVLSRAQLEQMRIDAETFCRFRSDAPALADAYDAQARKLAEVEAELYELWDVVREAQWAGNPNLTHECLYAVMKKYRVQRGSPADERLWNENVADPFRNGVCFDCGRSKDAGHAEQCGVHHGPYPRLPRTDEGEK